MVRAPCCEKVGLKKGPWTPEEDQILISYIDKYGHGNWRALPKQAGLLRCGKSCRLRWINYLRPDIKRGNFTKEEEETIINLHEVLGNRWSAIAARLPGRTDNEIKNVWHTHLKKKLKNSHGSSESKAAFSASSKVNSKKLLSEPQKDNNTSSMSTSSSPQEPSSSEISSATDTNSSVTTSMETTKDKATIKNESTEFSGDFPEIDQSFWSETLSDDNSDNPFEFSELLHQSSLTSSRESVELNCGFSPNIDDSMNFWYDLFISAGGSPELSEF